MAGTTVRLVILDPELIVLSTVPGSGFWVPGWLPGSGFVPSSQFTGSGSKCRVRKIAVVPIQPATNLELGTREPGTAETPGNLERTRNEEPNLEPRTRNRNRTRSSEDRDCVLVSAVIEGLRGGFWKRLGRMARWPDLTTSRALAPAPARAYISEVYVPLPRSEGSSERHMMPSQSPESQNRKTVLKNLVCRNCHLTAFTILLATDYHLYLRCNHCGQPLAIPERRRTREPTCSKAGHDE